MPELHRIELYDHVVMEYGNSATLYGRVLAETGRGTRKMSTSINTRPVVSIYFDETADVVMADGTPFDFRLGLRGGKNAPVEYAMAGDMVKVSGSVSDRNRAAHRPMVLLAERDSYPQIQIFLPDTETLGLIGEHGDVLSFDFEVVPAMPMVRELNSRPR